MSTKQRKYWDLLGSILLLAIFNSPCAAQVIYVLDGAGYPRAISIQQQISFGMGMLVQPVVSPDRMFVRTNITPIMFSPMYDPTTSVYQLFPAPNIGIFDGGAKQPAFMSLKPLAIRVGDQQQQVNPNLFPFAAQSMMMQNPFMMMPNQPAVFPFGPIPQPVMWSPTPPVPNQVPLQTNVMNPMIRPMIPLRQVQNVILPGVAQPGMFGPWQPQAFWGNLDPAQPGMVGPLVMPLF
jgi:hypothetical protein